MEKTSRRCCLGFLALFVVAITALAAGQAAAGTAALSLTITETWDGHNLDFSVTNSGYSDIYEFAIGNNYPDHQLLPYVNPGASRAPQYLTNGAFAYKQDGNWFTDIEIGPRALTWLDHAEGFDAYNTAFLYTSWGLDDSDYSGYLEDGFTNGYGAGSIHPQSPFAAYSESLGVNNLITGETSPVPIPGAVWILGSGLLGFFAVIRRQ